MKLKGWGTHFEWERSKEVAVFAVDSKVEQEKLAVVKELEMVLKEFSIPLDVIDGNLKRGEDVELVQTLLDSSIKDNEINYDEFERELLKAREEVRCLHYVSPFIAVGPKFFIFDLCKSSLPALS